MNENCIAKTSCSNTDYPGLIEHVLNWRNPACYRKYTYLPIKGKEDYEA